MNAGRLRFKVALGAWRLQVEVLPNAAAMRRAWRELDPRPLARGYHLHGLYQYSPRAPLGYMAFSAADLTAEIVAHEATHAAVQALRLMHGTDSVAADPHEEYLARTAGQLTQRLLRALARRGIEVR